MSPLVSIVIPCYNEEKYISACLQSIVGQSYLADLIEVIVVDGNSNDNSVAIVQKYFGKLHQLAQLKNPQKITPISLNIGVKSASGEIIVILGAHSFIHNDFVKNAVLALEDTDAVCVGGPIKNIGKSYTGRAIALAMKSSFGVGNSLFRISRKRQYVDTIAFGAYRKEVFEVVGYFDESLVRNQDFEFNQRIVKFGYKILLTPEITSYYYARNSLPQLFKQYFYYGYWKEKVIRKNISSFKIRYQIPVMFIIIMLSLFIGGFCFDSLWNYLGYLLCAYGSISLLFSLYTGKSNNYKYITILPLVFFTLHFAFGFGLLGGIFRNIIMKKNNDI